MRVTRISFEVRVNNGTPDRCIPVIKRVKPSSIKPDYQEFMVVMERDIAEKKVGLRINKWDGSAVKNALDDVVKDVLTKKYHYIEHFGLFDGRLFICGITVTTAIVALLCDYLYPFPACKHVLIICVCLYFLLMGVLTLYTTFKEKGIFVVAVQRDPAGFNPDMIWEASSYLKKYDDKYNLVLSVKNASTGISYTTSVTKSVANFIDINGGVISDFVEDIVVNMHDSLMLQRKDK